MSGIAQDVRHAIRRLARSPAFTAAVVLSLALGIGANGAVFSVVRGVLLTPLPFQEPERLVRVSHGHRERGLEPGAFSPQDFQDLRRQTEVFDALGSWWYVPGLSGMNLTGGGEPLRVDATFVSEGFFPLFGVSAARGRVLSPEENVPGRDRVAVLSDGFWRRRFGGDPEVVGRSIVLDGQPFTVVGVMPPEFTYPAEESDLWVPISLIGDDDIPHRRGLRWLNVVGRLAPRIDPEEARARTEALVAGLAQDHPESNEGWTEADVVPLRETIVGDVRPALLVLFAAVGIVLLVACANLANLFLVRAVGREREMAVRTALGAERGRLVRQVLVETVLVAGAGGLVGLLLAAWGIDALRVTEAAWGQGALPRGDAVRFDGAVVGFSLALSLVTGLAFGLLPALRASDLRLSAALSEGGGRGGDRFGNRAGAALVVAETALAVVLLVGAVLLVRSFWHLVQEDPGYRTEGVLTLSITTDSDVEDPANRYRYRRQVMKRVTALPGVVSVGGSKTLPLRGGGEPYEFQVPGRVEEGGLVRPESGVFIVTPGYFETLGIGLLHGRGFSWEAVPERPVLVVNRRLARQVWGREDVVGETLGIGENRIEVVGVVEDVRADGLATPPGSAAYVPPTVAPRATMKLFVRTAGEPLAFAEAVRQAIWEIRPEQPIAEVRALESVLREQTARPRLLVALVGSFAVLAAALAAVGLYGVIAYAVGRRTREIGVRMALGAGRRKVVAAVVGRSLALVAAGLVLGLFGAWAGAGLLSSQLYEVRPSDPASFAAVALLVVGTGVAAASIPARRASRVDPADALRSE
ncbi:MAG: ABC transporter permease [Thermoanaerobaculia bacterium]